jgi:hypothetical protein
MILQLTNSRARELLSHAFSPPSVPGAPPQSVSAFAESSTSLRVSWSPPPENKQNGLIAYYKIFYVPKTRSDSEATVVVIKNPAARDFVLDDLLKWTDYRLWMLAGTSVGDGPKSTPVEVKTDEDGMYVRVRGWRWLVWFSMGEGRE